MKRVAVFGLALTGSTVARVLAGKGIEVVLADDNADDAHLSLANELGCGLVDMRGTTAVDELLDGVDTLMPAPGVPPRHRVIKGALDRDIAVRTEIDVAYEWESRRPGGPRPIIGVTGTDGKTTTTMLVGSLLRANGLDVAEVGNTDVPFMGALDAGHDAFVVECSSFRLQFISKFRCDAATWLNIAPDHLDWHGSFDDYVAAKARIWAHARSTDVAVVPAGSRLIAEAASATPARVVTFGSDGADYAVRGGSLVSPHGVICGVDELWRSMPHDITNALAAAALVQESGLVTAAGLARPLAEFEPAHHRIEFIGEHAGSRWFDDSKATSPHAALTAIRAFDSLVLIAGGRNKDLDLGQMASEPGRMAGVVAIGDDAPLILEAFRNVCPVRTATSMAEAVAAAAAMASPGVDVVLSPGCTSYDWYRNYNERGEDFVRCVRAHFDAKGVS